MSNGAAAAQSAERSCSSSGRVVSRSSVAPSVSGTPSRFRGAVGAGSAGASPQKLRPAVGAVGSLLPSPLGGEGLGVRGRRIEVRRQPGQLAQRRVGQADQPRLHLRQRQALRLQSS